MNRSSIIMHYHERTYFISTKHVLVIALLLITKTKLRPLTIISVFLLSLLLSLHLRLLIIRFAIPVLQISMFQTSPPISFLWICGFSFLSFATALTFLSCIFPFPLFSFLSCIFCRVPKDFRSKQSHLAAPTVVMEIAMTFMYSMISCLLKLLLYK
jgi:hypothetical protein